MGESNILGRDILGSELVGELRHLRPALAGFGVTDLALFGSRARGYNREDSDIDLIVDVEPGRKFSLLDLISVEHTVADRFGLPVNAFLRRSLDADFLRSAEADQVLIFGG